MRIEHAAVHWGEERCAEKPANAHLLSALQSNLLNQFFHARQWEKSIPEHHGRAREPGVWKSGFCAFGQRVHGGIHGQPKTQVSRPRSGHSPQETRGTPDKDSRTGWEGRASRQSVLWHHFTQKWSLTQQVLPVAHSLQFSPASSQMKQYEWTERVNMSWM